VTAVTKGERLVSGLFSHYVETLVGTARTRSSSAPEKSRQERVLPGAQKSPPKNVAAGKTVENATVTKHLFNHGTSLSLR